APSRAAARSTTRSRPPARASSRAWAARWRPASQRRSFARAAVPCSMDRVLAELEERALVARANRGDAAAFDTLYREYRDWVAGVARRLTGDPDDALDVLQETYVWFFGRFPGFRLTSSLRSFLYPVVKHQAIAVLRRRRRVAGAEPDLGWSLPDEEAGDFHRVLMRLTPEQR